MFWILFSKIENKQDSLGGSFLFLSVSSISCQTLFLNFGLWVKDLEVFDHRFCFRTSKSSPGTISEVILPFKLKKQNKSHFSMVFSKTCSGSPRPVFLALDQMFWHQTRIFGTRPEFSALDQSFWPQNTVLQLLPGRKNTVLQLLPGRENTVLQVLQGKTYLYKSYKPIKTY